MTIQNWKKMDISPKISFIKGKAPKTLINNPEPGYLLYLTPELLRGNSPAVEYCSEKESVSVNNNEVIILWDGSNAGEIFKAKTGALASTMARINIQSLAIDSSYLFYFLKNYEYRIKNQVRGSGIPHVDRKVFSELPDDFPLNLSEQHKIAEILTTVDDAIEQTEALIRKYQRIKQGLMQDLLTRGVDENGEIRNVNLLAKTSIGNFPQHWNITTLGDIQAKYGGVIQTGPFGSQLHSFEYAQEGIPVIMPQDIADNGMINVQNIARISGKKASELSRHIVQANDVVFARRGDLSRCSAIKDREVGWLCGTGCMLVRFSPKIIGSGWLAAIYRHDIGQRQIQARAVGSTMVNLNSQLIKELFVPLPDINEQKAIMQLLEAQEKLISLERSNLLKMNLLKQGLMQDLLTGKVRVDALLKN